MIEAHIHPSKDGQYFVTIEESENSEVLFTSETYTRKENAEKAAGRVNQLRMFPSDVPVIDHTA